MAVNNVLRLHEYFVTDVCFKNLLKIFHQICVFVFFSMFLKVNCGISGKFSKHSLT